MNSLRCAMLVVLAAPMLLHAQENTWKAVTEIQSGSELRVVRKSAAQPIMAIMDEADDDRIVVVVKNEQVAIPRADILRIDARPKQTGSRVVKESKTTATNDPPDLKPKGGPKAAGGPSGSSSTTFSLGSKPDFKTIYRRPPDHPPAVRQ